MVNWIKVSIYRTFYTTFCLLCKSFSCEWFLVWIFKEKKTQTQVYGLQNLALIWTLFIMGLLSGTVIKTNEVVYFG